MERRFEVRKEELLAGCEVPAGMFHAMLLRLRKFVEPFLESLFRSEGRKHARDVCGRSVVEPEAQECGSDCLSP